MESSIAAFLRSWPACELPATTARVENIETIGTIEIIETIGTIETIETIGGIETIRFLGKCSQMPKPHCSEGSFFALGGVGLGARVQ